LRRRLPMQKACKRMHGQQNCESNQTKLTPFAIARLI
jgi:hypothetical protein